MYSISRVFKYLYFGNAIRICAASVCQLNCPVCAGWRIREVVGNGYLKFKDFKKIVDTYPNYTNIEISYGGELFLNPELRAIIQYAYARRINLTAHTGVNLNTVSEKTIESLVKYKFGYISISIDGASDSVYEKYRKGGSYTTVVRNIKLINYYKSKYNTPFPALAWQFIVFGHNEHELPAARKMAEELNMKFNCIFNSQPEYSPVNNKEFVSKQMGFKSAQDWEREQNEFGKNHQLVCEQLWESPQINWDGRLLGCCCNRDPFPANVFEVGVEKALANEKYVYAKKMLSGKAGPRNDIPCCGCPVYQWRQVQKCYVDSRRIVVQRCRVISNKLFRRNG